MFHYCCYGNQHSVYFLFLSSYAQCAAVALKRTLMSNIRMPEKSVSLLPLTFLFSDHWGRQNGSVDLTTTESCCEH